MSAETVRALRTSWDALPCALAELDGDGVVTAANAELLGWVGLRREQVEGVVRLPDLLTVGGRIYWETHLSPLLHVEGRLDEVALELRGSEEPLPVLLSARGDTVPPTVVHVALTSARERVRYEREVRQAQTAAELAASRVSLLLQVNEALSDARGVDAVADALLACARQLLGRTGAAVLVRDGVVGGGETMVEHGRFGDVPPTLETWGGRDVPLRSGAGLEGMLVLSPGEEPGADPLDEHVVTAVGLQGGLALERARLFEDNAHIAHELQHSLLVVDPPDDPRLDVAAIYRPGVAALEVGGDWYDVFRPGPRGTVSLVVGDVIGRGLAAAIAMGQLRSAVRALAGVADGPTTLLTSLDSFVDLVPSAAMSTLAYAEVDLETGHVRYACAGHPPPVLIPVDGPPRLVWEGRSTPLGSFVGRTGREEAELALRAGDRLLLFTDGLFERRDRALDVGLEAVRAAAAAYASSGERPLQAAVAALTTALLADERGADDVCVLLVRWAGSGFSHVLSADLTALSTTRHALDDWLRDRGIDDATRRDLVLATSEAIANAGEHGGDLRQSERIRVDAVVADGAVEVRVTDAGSWRRPRRGAARGRGFALMRALVDEVRVESGARTVVVLRHRTEGKR